MSCMSTYTGLRFDPMEIKPENICLEDIAHSLSLLCRGGGHLKWFYTVGQHSINCAKEARARGWSDRMVLACLLHDASEAYISDIIRPVKVHLSNYIEIERKIMNQVWLAFGLGDLTPEEHRLWKQIDDEILQHELKAMITGAEEMEVCTLASRPDFAEHDYREIEAEFLKMGRELELSL